MITALSVFPMSCSDSDPEAPTPTPPGPVVPDKPDEPQDDPEEPSLAQIQVSRLVTENGKTYVEVDGKPFPFLGAQLRLDAFLNCDKMKVEDVEKYIAKASELGLNCVQIPIYWNLIESEQGKYDFTVVDKILSYVNKYDLKMELLWFSTNMCGETFSYLTPQYVLKDSNKRFYRTNEGAFWDYYGYQYFLHLDDAWVLERETQAVTRLFNHIRNWDAEHGDRHPVIAAQIHNEPDIFMRWRLNDYKVAYRNGMELTKPAAWVMTLNALDAVGKAVQQSPYKVLTRVNLTSSDGAVGPFPQYTSGRPKDVFDLPGIDFISVDPYKVNIRDLRNEVMAYASIPGNYALVAENKGSYENTPSLLLASFAAGGGYDIYDLITSKFFMDHSGSTTSADVDHGVYTWDMKERSHTPDVRAIINGLRSASADVCRTVPDDFAAFNLSTSYPARTAAQSISTTGATFDFATDNGAIGFALDRGDYLIVYVIKDATVTIGNGTTGDAATGHYDAAGNFVEDSAVALDGATLNAQAGKLYRISFQSAGPLQSTATSQIGNKV